MKKICIILVVILIIIISYMTLLILDKNEMIIKQKQEIKELEETNKVYEEYINEYVPDDFIEEYNKSILNDV